MSIYTKKNIKKFVANYYELEKMAHSGDEEVMCVWIDIKTALNKLPYKYKKVLIDALIYDEPEYSMTVIEDALELMEVILNGR